MTYESQNNMGRSRRPADVTTMLFGKIPPQVPEVEEAVLAAILLEPECQDIVFDVLKVPEMFYLSVHQDIYRAIQELYKEGWPLDLLTVTEQLRKNGRLDAIGGAGYLSKLTMAILSSAHVETHCRLVAEKYMMRELIRIGAAAVRDGYEDAIDVFDLMERVHNEVVGITSDLSGNEPVSMARAALDVMRDIREQAQSKLTYTGVPSGFKDVDAKTSGWQKGNVIILAARPSVGKTSFLVNILVNAAANNYPVALFSLEMGKDEIIKRMLSALSCVEVEKVSNPNRMTPQEITLVDDAARVLSKLPVYIDDTAGLNHIQLRAKARKLKRKYNIQLIGVDYLQLMENTDKGLNREQQVSQNSRKIKVLAKDLEVPVIALSQLNRGVESEKSREPNLSDLRESGAIEQDADVVMFLSNPSPVALAKNPSVAGKILLKFAKGRNIGLGTVLLEFNKDLQKWKDVDRETMRAQGGGEQVSYEEKLANQKLGERGREMLNYQHPPVPAAFSFPPVDDVPF